MDDLVTPRRTYPRLHPDESGPGGFHVGRHLERYPRRYRDRVAVRLQFAEHRVTHELWINWEARGVFAGAIGSDDLDGFNRPQRGAFRYALTGLPALDPT